jgi:ubiquinone/menaquinone biosynthesis C-methylase UbiE
MNKGTTSMLQSQNNESLREWHDSAPYWEKHASTIRTMFAPVTAALVEEAKIVVGQKVLDVAGGAGEPSLTIAEVVGSSGSVVFTDAIPEMVTAAKSEGRRRGLTNIEFDQCSADSLPFPIDLFDVVVSRLGIMFFPDPLAALREMLRVAKPGGRLSLVVWGASEANPFSYVVTNVVSRYVQTLSTGAATHDAFCFAEPGRLAAVLKEAGAANIRERVLEFDIAAPISPDEFWAMRSEISGTLREKLKTLSTEQRAQLTQALLEAVREFFPNNRMSFPAQMLIVSGKKPARPGRVSEEKY